MGVCTFIFEHLYFIRLPAITANQFGISCDIISYLWLWFVTTCAWIRILATCRWCIYRPCHMRTSIFFFLSPFTFVNRATVFICWNSQITHTIPQIPYITSILAWITAHKDNRCTFSYLSLIHSRISLYWSHFNIFITCTPCMYPKGSICLLPVRIWFKINNFCAH